MNDCLFCNIEDNLIFENQYFYSIFDIHPVSPGHTLVISKDHIVSLFDLHKEQWLDLQDAIRKTVEMIVETNTRELYQNMIKKHHTEKSIEFCEKMLNHIGIDRKPEGYNIGNNEGEMAGRTIHHLHIQIIPRFKGDVENPIGGIRNVIPRLGDYKS